MGYNPEIHQRRSIRLKGHDYAGGGVYFVTLCVAERRPLFGTVVNGRMALNAAGRTAAACWRDIPKHFPRAAVDGWIVMPDHVHGIVVIGQDGHPVPAGADDQAPRRSSGRPCGTAGTLGSILRGFKIGVTKVLGGDSPWQRNYYDIIVRDTRALNNIRRYIQDNPAQWDTLRYGEPRFRAGNRALLDLELTAFLASRTGERSFALASGGGEGERSFALASGGGEGERSFAPTPAPGGGESFAAAQWPKRPAAVIGGFLSPMERAVFEACLAAGTPMVWILAHGLPERFPQRIQHAIEGGRLLVLTPFAAGIEGFSAARAAWCNQYALHLAARAVIGRLAPDGMLACLLADLRHDIPVHYLEVPLARRDTCP